MSKVRVMLNMTKPPLELANDGVAVYEGLKDHPDFKHPPVPLDDFKNTLDEFTTSIYTAADGGKKAIIERNKLRDEVVKMMRKLGHWVEANCDQDVAKLRSTGFLPAYTNRPGRASQVPLPQPIIRKLQNGPATGQIRVSVSPLQGARNYELRYAVNDNEGRPGAWTVLPPYQNSRNISVNGLTPGNAYLFQIRAFGNGKLTDWSDSATRIAI